jgi:hypothetical protein
MCSKGGQSRRVVLPPTFTDEGLRTATAAPSPGLSVVVLSQYVEQLYARGLLADQACGVGYLLKDRVFNDDQFTDTRPRRPGLPEYVLDGASRRIAKREPRRGGMIVGRGAVDIR